MTSRQSRLVTFQAPGAACADPETSSRVRERRGGALSTEDLVHCYLVAKRLVVDAGYEGEIAWQTSVRPADVTSTTFLREAAWVVLSSGMRESVVRARFPLLALVLHNFDPDAVVQDPRVRSSALRVFRHERKIDAILSIARVARSLGTRGIRRSLVDDPGSLLENLPYIGPITGRHLAKNLGLSVAKPDRHLVRLARAACRLDPDLLCEEIGRWLGEPIPVVDVVLWRWATLHQARCQVEACHGLPHT